MPYQPSFTEVFLGYLAVLFWSTWLGRKGQWPAGMHYGPIALGALLMGSMAVAMWSTMSQSIQGFERGTIDTARWAGVAFVAIGLALDLAFTVRHFRGPRPA